MRFPASLAYALCGVMLCGELLRGEMLRGGLRCLRWTPPPRVLLRKVFKILRLGPDFGCKVLILQGAHAQSIHSFRFSVSFRS